MWANCLPRRVVGWWGPCGRRLGDWALAEQKLRHCPGPSFEVGLARCLVHLRAGNAAAFQEAVGGARGELLPALGAASMEARGPRVLLGRPTTILKRNVIL